VRRAAQPTDTEVHHTEIRRSGGAESPTSIFISALFFCAAAVDTEIRLSGAAESPRIFFHTLKRVALDCAVRKRHERLLRSAQVALAFDRFRGCRFASKVFTRYLGKFKGSLLKVKGKFRQK